MICHEQEAIEIEIASRNVPKSLAKGDEVLQSALDVIIDGETYV